MSDRIHFERRGRIAIVTIDRPESLNALDQPAARELWNAWTEFKDDPELWVQITIGAGNRSFCAGADLKYGLTGGKTIPGEAPYWGVLTERWQCWKPQIAAVNGYCLGGGLELALVHDLIVAADHATFGLPEVKWNGISGTGVVRLPKQIPHKPAMEMILTGKPIDAETALRYGLVNRVVHIDRLLDNAIELAESICENGPLAVRASKQIAMRALDSPLNAALSIAPGLSWEVNNSEDRKEGPLAFAEKRKPKYQGR